MSRWKNVGILTEKRETHKNYYYGELLINSEEPKKYITTGKYYLALQTSTDKLNTHRSIMAQRVNTSAIMGQCITRIVGTRDLLNCYRL